MGSISWKVSSWIGLFSWLHFCSFFRIFWGLSLASCLLFIPFCVPLHRTLVLRILIWCFTLSYICPFCFKLPFFLLRSPVVVFLGTTPFSLPFVPMSPLNSRLSTLNSFPWTASMNWVSQVLSLLPFSVLPSLVEFRIIYHLAPPFDLRLLKKEKSSLTDASLPKNRIKPISGLVLLMSDLFMSSLIMAMKDIVFVNKVWQRQTATYQLNYLQKEKKNR